MAKKSKIVKEMKRQALVEKYAEIRKELKKKEIMKHFVSYHAIHHLLG